MGSKTSRGKISICFTNTPLESKGGELNGWLGEVLWLPLRCLCDASALPLRRTCTLLPMPTVYALHLARPFEHSPAERYSQAIGRKFLVHSRSPGRRVGDCRTRFGASGCLSANYSPGGARRYGWICNLAVYVSCDPTLSDSKEQMTGCRTHNSRQQASTSTVY